MAFLLVWNKESYEVGILESERKIWDSSSLYSSFWLINVKGSPEHDMEFAEHHPLFPCSAPSEAAVPLGLMIFASEPPHKRALVCLLSLHVTWAIVALVLLALPCSQTSVPLVIAIPFQVSSHL
jgi:hypothetical protein